MFEKNVGSIDRVVRLVIGIALLIAGIFFISSGTTVLGYVLVGVSVIPFGTALLSTCPLYSLFGVSTCPVKA